ncbi:MAG: alpha-ketoglutarate-dependent dioxygenase AlkB [Dermatophilaceae bacterium]
MSTPRQGCLLDLAAAPALGELGGTVRRVHLTHRAWVDVRPGWLAGADVVFDALLERVPWQEQRRRMYDAVLDVPRLTRFYAEGEALPLRILDQARAMLGTHYAALAEPFATAGMCLYRDGRDSVAWHGDRIGRGATHDTMVAILSVGATRTLALRPRGGGATALRVGLGHGDLLVMGGSCQRTWEHAVPKTAKPVGPRISIQFHPPGVR